MKKLLFLFMLTTSLFTYAHEGHHVPGAIPPSPNGGKLAEAKHVHSKNKHDHSHASKVELFFEGLIKDNKLSIFPLELDPKTSKIFLEKALLDFKNTDFVVFDARKGKRVNIQFNSEGKSWMADMSKIRGRRYIIEIQTMYNGAKYKAKLQIEK